MPRRLSCRRCGRPNAKALCDSCRGQTYGSDEYKRNAAYLKSQVRFALSNGVKVYCFICDKPILRPSDVTAEHRVGVAFGGSNSLSNLEPAHAGCNFAKRPKSLGAG